MSANKGHLSQIKYLRNLSEIKRECHQDMMACPTRFRSVSQSVGQSASQPVSLSVGQPASQSVSWSASQSIGQPVRQSVG